MVYVGVLIYPGISFGGDGWVIWCWFAGRRLIMEYRRLGGSGFTVPVLSFGCGAFGGS